jgi:hypothetical protein
MKKVVKTLPKTEVIALNKITDDSIIGIKWGSGEKAWVTQINDKEFISIYVGDQFLTGCWKRESKRKYIENAMEQSGTEVYCFENKNELLKFLLGK